MVEIDSTWCNGCVNCHFWTKAGTSTFISRFFIYFFSASLSLLFMFFFLCYCVIQHWKWFICSCAPIQCRHTVSSVSKYQTGIEFLIPFLIYTHIQSYFVFIPFSKHHEPIFRNRNCNRLIVCGSCYKWNFQFRPCFFFFWCLPLNLWGTVSTSSWLC